MAHRQHRVISVLDNYWTWDAADIGGREEYCLFQSEMLRIEPFDTIQTGSCRIDLDFEGFRFAAYGTTPPP